MNRSELKEKIDKAKFAYYNTGNPIMSDNEYDSLIKKYGYEPSIGSPVLDFIKKIKITNKPMLSLDKVHNEKEIISFANKNDIVASIKCDGLSIRLIYKNGILISANTRGDGFVGGDVTEHIKYFLNVPFKIPKINNDYIIDGEAVIYENDFNLINKNQKFKNSRNAASGSLALLDMNIVKQRRLSFIAWDIIQGGKSSNYYNDNIEEANALGFTTVPIYLLNNTEIEEKKITNINQTLLNVAKNKGIPCDGIVWRINNIQEGNNRGKTFHHFLNAIAWKPNDETYETKLKNIEWSMGRIGILTPVAIYNDIEIEGTICNRANLHNYSIMKELFHNQVPIVNQEITIFKSNQIIPQVKSVKKYEIKDNEEYQFLPVPIICPYCGKHTKIKQDNNSQFLYCDNPLCEGKLINKLEHFCGKKGLDIKGLSKATFQKLIDWEWLENLEGVFNLYQYRDEWIKKPGFGIKSVDKILDSIEEHRHTTLNAFISAIGIPLIGQAVAKDLTKYFRTYEEFRKAVDDKDYYFYNLNNFGEEMNNSIKNFDYSEADKISKILIFEVPVVSNTNTKNNLSGKNIVITGKLTTFKNRNELKQLIESYGGKVIDNISTKVSFLINNDINSPSSKNKKAKELNIPIISEQDFLEKYIKN